MIPKPGCYEFLPHTADAKFKAFGKTANEAYRNAARAMFAIMTDIDQVKKIFKFPVNVRSSRKESLLFDFLDNLIFLLDTEGFLLADCDVKVANNRDGTWSITGHVVGDSVKGYDVSGNVKAVTYNDLEVLHRDNQWLIQVVVDI